MTCRCATSAEHTARAESRAAEDARADERRRLAASPDARQFHILDGAQIGPHLVLKVKYPNCTLCAYEGVKVMVFLNRTSMDALRWKKIDPHFADPVTRHTIDEAPSPAARFPASKKGWDDAINYARAQEREQEVTRKP